MCRPLAYAESVDPTSMNLLTVLGGALIVAVIAILAAVLILIVRARRHPSAELISVATIFWAMITAGSLLYTAETQMNWSK